MSEHCHRGRALSGEAVAPPVSRYLTGFQKTRQRFGCSSLRVARAAWGGRGTLPSILRYSGL